MDAEIIRVCRMLGQRSSAKNKIYRYKLKHGLKKYHWYTKCGYKLEDAIKIVYHITEGIPGKDPDRAAALLTAAHADLSDGIPVSLAADLLGIEKPEFKVGGKFHNGEPLPFSHHPRLRMYWFIRRTIANKKEVKELYERRTHSS